MTRPEPFLTEDGVRTGTTGRDLRSGRAFAARPGRALIVMRDDMAYVVAGLAARLSGHAPVAWPVLITALSVAYRSFQEDVRRALYDCAAGAERPDLHIVDGIAVGQAVRARIHTAKAISLDPLVEGVAALGISRGFELGGRRPCGLVARPGFPPVASQAIHLRQTLMDDECTLVEDDIHTGGTIAGVLGILAGAGVRVAKVVTGIVAGPAVLGSLGVPVEPVLRYVGVPDRIDVADPRNFLLGVSGLVVRLPTGCWGRAPYWLPFVTTSARVVVDPAQDDKFARVMVRANARFYERVERSTHCRIRVGHLHPAVRMLLATTVSASAETRVGHLLDGLADRLDRGDRTAGAGAR